MNRFHGLLHCELGHDARSPRNIAGLLSIEPTDPCFANSKIFATLPLLVVAMARRPPSEEPLIV